jgi:hypothetical protein
VHLKKERGNSMRNTALSFPPFYSSTTNILVSNTIEGKQNLRKRKCKVETGSQEELSHPKSVVDVSNVLLRVFTSSIRFCM